MIELTREQLEKIKGVVEQYKLDTDGRKTALEERERVREIIKRYVQEILLKHPLNEESDLEEWIKDFEGLVGIFAGGKWGNGDKNLKELGINKPLPKCWNARWGSISQEFSDWQKIRDFIQKLKDNEKDFSEELFKEVPNINGLKSGKLSPVFYSFYPENCVVINGPVKETIKSFQKENYIPKKVFKTEITSLSNYIQNSKTIKELSQEIGLEKDLGNFDYFCFWYGENFLKTPKKNKIKEETPPDEEHPLYKYFQDNGFYFPEEFLTNYYLSLKTKPLVILTGISGTGKTKLAQLFAKYMCENDKKRYAFISVRPDWMDNRGLLGFYNLITEKYQPTKLLKLMLRAKKEPDKPFFVILDEMNLAKVEYYFSDFLSCLETRGNGENGESINLYIKESKDEKGEPIPDELEIPLNLYFTGTVNIDETTYMFSPKVLDRANTIEFNEVDLKKYAGKESSEEKTGFVLKEKGNFILDLPKKGYYESLKDIKINDKSVQERLEEINETLSKFNLHFGYRVANEIALYMKNAKELVVKDEKDLRIAFDFQILQKILPKFHGSEQKLEIPLKELLQYCCIDKIEELDKKLLENITIVNNEIYYQKPKTEGEKEEENKEGKEEKLQVIAIFPRSAKKIHRMLKVLQDQGFVSFVE